MVWDHKNNGIALFIMSAVIALNVGLAANFIAASGVALAAMFHGQNIFVLAGAELIAVLMTYVISKHRSFAIPARIHSRVKPS